jgi:hypothetical protein
MLTSHVATLAYYGEQGGGKQEEGGLYEPVVGEIEARLGNTILRLKGEVAVGEDIAAAAGSAREGLRMLNDRMNGLVEQRKAELEQGTMESATRKELSVFKPIADQFNFIDNVTINIEKLSKELTAGAS